MNAIIKTWPAFVDPRTVAQVFSREGYWARYYFTLGRGKPQRPVERLFFTWRGRILGSFRIKEIVRNDGSLPRLESLSGEEGDWQIKPDHWVAICPSGCDRLKERLFMSGFRGYRYFDLDSYRNTAEAGVRL